MRTSLQEIKQIDDFFSNQLPQQEALLFDAKTILDPSLSYKVRLHQIVVTMAMKFGRKKIKAEIAAVEQKAFAHRDHLHLQQRVEEIFSKS